MRRPLCAYSSNGAGTYKAISHTDYLYCAGGGTMGHPGGVAAGVTSLRQASSAALKGIPLETYARSHRELAEALEHFRPRHRSPEQDG